PAVSRGPVVPRRSGRGGRRGSRDAESPGRRGGLAGRETGRPRRPAARRGHHPGRFFHPADVGAAGGYRTGRLPRTGDDLMPFRVTGNTLRAALAGRQSDRPLAGMWICSGSPLIAEICAGAGLDWVLIDMEHCPNGLESVLTQLQAVAAYPVTPVVRVPANDPVL